MIRSTNTIALALLAGACKSTPGPASDYEHRIVVQSVDDTLPDDLHAERYPVVRMLMHHKDEADIEQIEGRMDARGFRLISRQPSEGTRVSQLRFFGHPTEVLHTTSASVSWVASQALWNDQVPFGWAMSMGEYLFVPGTLADRARQILTLDNRIRGRVILANGSLQQDMLHRR